MVIEITKMEKEEREMMYLRSTYFNLHFNRTQKYKKVYDSLIPLFPKSGKELWCLITNTARSLKHKATGMQIPRKFEPYKDSPQGMTHYRMCNMLDALENEGYLDYYKGGLVNMNKDKKVPSIYVPTPKYLALWEGVDVSKEKSDNPYLQIRDRLEKEELSTKGHKGVAEMKVLIKEYNDLLEHTDIAVAGSPLPIQQYKRVFSEDLSKGGRWYNLAGSIQTMPSHMRGGITINGQPTAELDFKALHPFLLYARIEKETGVSVDMKDPYDVDCSGLISVDPALCGNNNPTRNLIKQIMLRCLNARCAADAHKSVTSKWVEEYAKGDKGLFYGAQVVTSGGTFPAKALCDRVVAAHPLIKEAFFSDVGLLLQRTDSDIMGRVIKAFLDIEACALSWHDSVVVQTKYRETAYSHMLRAYNDVVGSSSMCYIE